nr:hypothetical protein [Tanacetum cinerariifolium]
MFTPLPFWMAVRRRALVSGLGPPSFTAITISLPMRVKSFDIRSHRFILRPFRNSNARPILSIIQLAMNKYQFGVSGGRAELNVGASYNRRLGGQGAAHALHLGGWVAGGVVVHSVGRVAVGGVKGRGQLGARRHQQGQRQQSTSHKTKKKHAATRITKMG